VRAIHGARCSVAWCPMEGSGSAWESTLGHDPCKKELLVVLLPMQHAHDDSDLIGMGQTFEGVVQSYAPREHSAPSLKGADWHVLEVHDDDDPDEPFASGVQSYAPRANLVTWNEGVGWQVSDGEDVQDDDGHSFGDSAWHVRWEEKDYGSFCVSNGDFPCWLLKDKGGNAHDDRGDVDDHRDHDHTDARGCPRGDILASYRYYYTLQYPPRLYYPVCPRRDRATSGSTWNGDKLLAIDTGALGEHDCRRRRRRRRERRTLHDRHRTTSSQCHLRDHCRRRPPGRPWFGTGRDQEHYLAQSQTRTGGPGQETKTSSWEPVQVQEYQPLRACYFGW
jgi:hypothetical protein